MNLLLDTHTLLWYADGSTRLSARAKALLDDPTNSLHLSMATLWEVAIKTGIGKLTLSSPYGTYMRSAMHRRYREIADYERERCAWTHCGWENSSG